MGQPELGCFDAFGADRQGSWANQIPISKSPGPGSTISGSQLLQIQSSPVSFPTDPGRNLETDSGTEIQAGRNLAFRLLTAIHRNPAARGCFPGARSDLQRFRRELTIRNVEPCAAGLDLQTAHFRIVNTTSTPVALSELTVRYYFTIDGARPLNYWCDWATIGCANVTGRFWVNGLAEPDAPRVSNIVLLGSFLLGKSPFAALERWQTRYAPVYVAWAAMVVVVFPPLFGFD